MSFQAPCQGAPSTIRCIKTASGEPDTVFPTASQGASSTIRCIKTTSWRRPTSPTHDPAREHPAPPGALRLGDEEHELGVGVDVREQPAPSGALRRLPASDLAALVDGRSGSTQHHQVH